MNYKEPVSIDQKILNAIITSQLIGKDPDAGKDWGQEKEATEDEMVGWHHQQMDMNLSKLWEMVKDREAWYAVV